MSKNLILNGVYSVEPIEIKRLKCFKASLKCSYDICKRRLHEISINLLLKGQLATYELKEESAEKCSGHIYVKDDSVINIVKNKLSDILDGSFEYVGEKDPPYSAIETFFDLLVDLAFRRAGFKRIRGRGTYLDRDGQKAISKRTVIKIEHDNDDNKKYHGVLFIDYSNISRESLAYRLIKKLGIKNFSSLKKDDNLRIKAIELANSYVGKTVLTMMRRGNEYEYVYGKIVNVENTFACEKKLLNNQTIYDLWIERYRKDEKVKSFTKTKPDIWEFPLFYVEVKVSQGSLIYPPSLLRPIEAPEHPDPATRWDEISEILRSIEDNIKEVYKKLTGRELKFEYIKYDLGSQLVGIRLNFYTDEDTEKPFLDTTVKLKYKYDKDKEIDSYKSPLYAFSEGYMPYAGRQELKLLVIYLSSISKPELDKFVDYLSTRFRELNFGSIAGCNYYSYTYDPTNLSESLTSLEKTLQQALSSCSNLEHLPLILIPDSEKFYELSKKIASSKGFHTQLVKLESFNKVMSFISDIENPNTSLKDRIKKALSTLIANICGGVYAEYLIQRNRVAGKISGPLTWILAEAADKTKQSMYVGLDISTKKGISGAAFILLDPYGKFIDTRIIQLKSEALGYEEYYEILRYMVSKARDQNLRDQNLKRIVILRDGIPRTPLELAECLQAFNKVINELGYKTELVYVAVIKRSIVRIFGSNNETKVNPVQGTYAYLYKLKHLGYNAHEVLVVASKARKASKPRKSEESKPRKSKKEELGTVRPVILRVYELGKEYDVEELKRIAEEYLALTRLNFWNLTTGASKLALPVKMADILSYMLSMGIPIGLTK